MPRKTSPYSRIRQKILQAETLEQRLALTGNARLVADISTSPAGVFDGAIFPNDDDEAFHPGEYFIDGAGTTFFAASEGLGLELWRTDGTGDGTIRVSDLSRTDIARPKYPTEYAGDLYFLSGVGDSGGSLWRSDGTNEGTERLFQDLPVNDIESTDDGLLIATEWGGLVRWDGSEAVDLAMANRAKNIAIVDDEIYFTANSDLWVSDGTPNSGIKVAQSVLNQTVYFYSDPVGFVARGDYAQHLAKLGGWTYYLSGHFGMYAIGRTDGTENSGEIVVELPPTEFVDPPRLSAHEGKLVITPAAKNSNDSVLVYDPESGLLGPIDETTKRNVNRLEFPSDPDLDFFVEERGIPSPLWRTDGTEAGTVQLIDSAFAFTPAKDSLFFVRGEIERELWKTDGTIAGTVPVKDLTVGGEKYPRIETSLDGTIYFLGDDGTEAGLELWKSDGTIEGTVLVKDIHPGTTGSFDAASFDSFNAEALSSPFGVAGHQLFISTNTMGAWKHDLQSGETSQLHFQNAGSHLTFGNDLVVSGSQEIWRSNGLTDQLIFQSDDLIDTTFIHNGEIYAVTRDDNYRATLHSVARGTLVEIGGRATHWTSVGDSIVYSYNDNVWQTNGSEKGRVIIHDREIDRSRRLGDEVIFSTRDVGVNDSTEVWRTDGTYEGTQLLLAAETTLSDSAEFEGDLFFFARNESPQWQLWQTDGTRKGTEPVPGITSHQYFNAVASSSNGLLVFVGDRTGEKILWNIDPGLDGSETISEIARIPSEYDDGIRFSDDMLQAKSFFKITRSYSPWREELWRTDGTPAGTELLLDMNPNGVPRYEKTSQIPVRVGDLMYFTADDGTHGMELWQTDGTSQGTQMVQDIRPGEFGSYPTYLTNIDGQLYFSANDGVHGIEPWVFEPAETTIGDTNADGIVDSTDLEVVGLNWQQAAFGPENGDFNSDGFVDSADLNLLGINWQSDAARGSLARAALADPVAKQSSSNRLAVPEVDSLGESVRERTLRPQIAVRLRRSR